MTYKVPAVGDGRERTLTKEEIRALRETKHRIAEHMGNRLPVRPVPVDLASAEGRRRVLDTARRVMETHADVLTALARR